jgi:hypothetical protein
MMFGWRDWRESLRRAGGWDEASPADPEVRRLKALFAEAHPPEEPGADERLWRKVRVRIRTLEREARERAEAPLSWALAAFGFRFAGAAALALALAVGLTWPEGPFSSSSPALTGVQTASYLEAPEEVLNGPLQAGSGEDLLQFIAYGPAGR